MSQQKKAFDYSPALGAIAAWSVAPALIAFVAGMGFDPFSQTFYRYLSASVFMLLLCAFLDRPGLTAALGRWRSIAPMALSVAVFQTGWTMAIYVVGPTITVFAEHTSVVFGIAGGAVLFRDERRIVTSWRFWPGVAVVLGCAVGVVLGGGMSPSWAAEPGTLLTAGALLLISAMSWSVYALLIKRLVTSSDRREAVRPMPAFAVSITGAAALTFVVALLWGNLDYMAKVPLWQAITVVGSGVIGVGVGQSLYFVSIRRVGVVLSQTITLATPFFAGLVAFLVVGDRMNAMQWIYGTGMMAGVAYLMASKLAVTSPEPAEEPAFSGT